MLLKENWGSEFYKQVVKAFQVFPDGSVVKNPPANAGDAGLIPGWERSPGEVNSNPLQYSCLGNPMDWGAWRALDHGVTKSCIVDTTQQLNSKDISWDWSLAAPLSSMLGVRKERNALKWQTYSRKLYLESTGLHVE